MPAEGSRPRWTNLTLVALFVALFALVGVLSTALVIQRQLPDVVAWRVAIVLVIILAAALIINRRFRTVPRA